MLIGYVLLGVALGVGSSVLPGPCNLAVMTAACRHSLRRAVATGAGAALGDAGYAALGVVGLGPVLARHPGLPPLLNAVSGIALIAYGVATLRTRAPHRVLAGDAASVRPGHARRGCATGLGLLLANPGAFVTWVVVVGTALGGATMAQGGCVVAGIGAGSFAWFTLVAWLTSRGRRRLGDRVVRAVVVVSCLLVAYGALSLLRAAHAWAAC